MSRICFALVAAFVLGACSTEGAECENTLTLDSGDHGSTQSIEDGCTSLLVTLPTETTVDRAAVPTFDATVLRFDYRMTGADATDYYFTPLRTGVTTVTIGAEPSTASWSATVQIALPD